MDVRKILVSCATAILFAVGLFGATATAGPSRVTKGDAQAVLEAFGNGGWAVIQHSRVAHGAPAQGLPGAVTIRPFSGSPFDGAHYCALDWHALAIADIEPGPRRTAADAIAGLTVWFTLDGAPFPIDQTAIKRFLNPERFGLADAYYSQWGKVMSPSDLAPGSHSLTVVFSDSAGPFFTDGITFFVDAAGAGACL